MAQEDASPWGGENLTDCQQWVTWWHLHNCSFPFALLVFILVAALKGNTEPPPVVSHMVRRSFEIKLRQCPGIVKCWPRVPDQSDGSGLALLQQSHHSLQRQTGYPSHSQTQALLTQLEDKHTMHFWTILIHSYPLEMCTITQRTWTQLIQKVLEIKWQPSMHLELHSLS